MTNWKAIAGKIAAVVLVIAMIAAVLLPVKNMGQDAPVTASVVKGGSMQKTTQDVSITAFAATLDKTPAVVDFIAVDAEVSEIVIPEAARYLAADETSAAVQAIPAVQLHKEEAEAKALAEAEAAAAAQRAAEQKAAEEAAKKAAEQKAAEEARKAAEQKAAEEAARKAEESKKEESSKAEEPKKEESSKAEESKKEESSKAEESKKEESSKTEESKKEESSKAEESKKEESSKAEESKAEESKVEESKVEESKVEESKTEESSAEEEPAEEEPAESEPEPEPEEPVDDTPLNAYMGVNYYNGHKETYYNMYMGGLIEAMNRGGWAYNDCINKDIIDNILDTSGYWIRSDGCKMFGSYIILAASEYEYRRGSIVSTSLGTGIVLDRGVGPGVIDIAVNW